MTTLYILIHILLKKQTRNWEILEKSRKKQILENKDQDKTNQKWKSQWSWSVTICCRKLFDMVRKYSISIISGNLVNKIKYNV